jgi:hypothetical protein
MLELEFELMLQYFAMGTKENNGLFAHKMNKKNTRPSERSSNVQ